MVMRPDNADYQAALALVGDPLRDVTQPALICCDLDGVIWRGEDPIPGAAAGVAQLRDAGLRVVFLTNNSSGRVRDNVARLAAAGVDASADDVAYERASRGRAAWRGRGPPMRACSRARASASSRR